MKLALVSGLANGLVSPPLHAVLADVTGGRPEGKVIATFQASADLGTILGALAGGLLADVAGFRAAFLGASLLPLIALVPWLGKREGADSKVRISA